MSVIDKLSSHEIWISFLDEKMSTKNMDKGQIEDLSSFIHNREYLGVIDIIKNKENFQPPVKKMVSKQYSSKKRIVYSFSREENYVLKLLTYLLIRQYDYIFAKNLYSFRAKHGVKKAIDYLRRDRHLSNKYVYKVDIHDYFNSVDINILLPNLKEIMKDDIDAYSFIERLLTDSRAVTPNGDIIYEKKGIMAGVPLSSFLANVYLCQLDWYFYNNGNRYARYSDDMIVFANSDLERQNYVTYIHSYLADMHLSVNCEKESFSNPHEQWDFLGVSYHDGIFDISPISAKKLKKKMWRKSRALLRWKNRKHIENIYAAKAFVKAFNKKLYDNPITSELTWTRWFFPIINTTETISMLDHYMQECIRYIATEKRTNKRYSFKYDMIKDLGYRSLVHEYYIVMEENIYTES
ncbi:hypothetical protein ST42_01995 [Prevotella pectinovora]|nr:hypothetical protein ST42_01995 [Prevotella pectinovora]